MVDYTETIEVYGVKHGIYVLRNMKIWTILESPCAF